jgi:hypothetical protein
MDDMLHHMYGLEKEIDLSFLTSRELIQVAIGSFQVQFHFDEDVTVSVEAGFRYFDGRYWIHSRSTNHTTLPDPARPSSSALKIDLSGVENKDLRGRTWPRSIFILGGAPKAHEF